MKITKYSKKPYLGFKTPAIMGILNITPDSFSDGGKFLKNYAANKQVRKLIKDGDVEIQDRIKF